MIDPILDQKRQHLDSLIQDYRSAYTQLNQALSELERTRLKRTIANLESEIRRLQAELGPEPPRDAYPVELPLPPALPPTNQPPTTAPSPPEENRNLLAQARSFLDRGAFDEAAGLLRKAHSRYPDDEAVKHLYLEAVNSYGTHLFVSERKLHQAKSALLEVLKLDPYYDNTAQLLQEVETQIKSPLKQILYRTREILRDPVWQGIGAIVGILACILAAWATPSVQGILWPPSPTSTSTPTPMPTMTPTPTNPPTATYTPTITPTLTPSFTPHSISPCPPLSISTPVPVVTRISARDGAVMVYIPPGEFLMGSARECDPELEGDEEPQRVIYLDAFWIDRTEVTNAQYLKCFNAGVCKRYYYQDNDAYGNSDQPVVGVRWEEAKAYCQWAGRELPTEAQWEKAARSTDGRIYTWGAQIATCQQAVLKEGDNNGCGKNAAWPVGSKPEDISPYGALDMTGNVWEWVADWYHESYYKTMPSSNPPGPESNTGKPWANHRVIRGGSWANDWRQSRVAHRYSMVQTYDNADLGFRCADSRP